MIDTTNEKLLSLSDIARILPPSRRSRPVTVSCVLRWILSGVRVGGQVVKLEAVRLGGRWLSTAEALDRFAKAQTPQAQGPAVPPRTSARRQRAAERAARQLEKMGV